MKTSEAKCNKCKKVEQKNELVRIRFKNNEWVWLCKDCWEKANK